MGLTLTQLASDNFNRANVSPLQSPWAIDTFGDPGIRIVSDVCEATTNAECTQLYEYAGGNTNDGSASVTVNTSGPHGGYYELYPSNR